ncbi:hypothetical protein M3B20_01410 [Corynebacterium sanguinis]|uniref:hypothetical protein n=1 Tax=Corynebacterium sanguinis TaxID=2594913 RepID=UPI0021A2AFC5|nr:hypothetical protein [Corynebacterium sanguinis]MCT1804393.1 hypothetical protein [Corynebacterium sanguinis]
MPRPDPKRPREGQLGLFESEAVKQPDMVLRGRHSAAMDRAITAATDRDLLDDVDEGILTVLRAAAWSLDSFESQNKPYGPSKLIDPLVNALREAHLTPDSRAESTDEAIKELLHDLGTAATSDAALHDTPDAR